MLYLCLACAPLSELRRYEKSGVEVHRLGVFFEGHVFIAAPNAFSGADIKA
jgi:hypothetical protein